MKKSIGAGLIALSLAACGGGGGGSPAAQVPVTPTTPAPTVTLAISQSKVALGSSATLTWSSTNSTSCTASGAWSGTQATSGTSAQTPTVAGAGTYTLTCTGSGGTANQSVSLIVPIPVLKSSYENKIAAVAVIGSQPIPETGNLPGWNTVAYAFGDFFQDGSYALITHTQESDNGKPYAQGATQGHIKIWKKDSAGTWIDHTSDLLSDNTGCILARKVLIADFNGDGIPDAYISCSGFDAPPYAGEAQRILLSDASTHKYKNTALPVVGYAHGASAADINHDGKIDVVVADMQGNNGKNPLYVLKGNGDGTFNVDYKMVSRPEIDYQANGPIFTVELIDFDKNGTYGLIAGGIETVTHRSVIMPYDSVANTFATKPLISLPNDTTYISPYDFIFDSSTNTIYVNRVNDVSTWGTNWPANVGNSIQKIDYRTLAASTIFTHVGFYNQPQSLTWIEWIGFYENNVVGLNSGFAVSVKK
jgi:hypothetical protein